jgi:hypothetical protein
MFFLYDHHASRFDQPLNFRTQQNEQAWRRRDDWGLYPTKLRKTDFLFKQYFFTKQYVIIVEEGYLQSNRGMQGLWLEVRVLKPIIHVAL